MRTLTRDGVSLCYQDAGAGGTPMVFVPGGSCDWWSFHRQLEHFSADRRCVALDLRGHGASDKPRQAYTISGYADDVAWVIAQLGLGRPVVVGHSMGGAIALELAARHSQAVRAVVLVDPAPIAGNTEGYEQLLGAFARRGVEETRRRSFTRFFLPGADPALIEAVLDHGATTPDHVFASEIEGLRDWDGQDAASRCRIPALFIAAAEPLCPPAVLSRAIPHLVIGQTVGAGHFNMLEVPEQVNSMIEHFLRQHVPPK